jgi:hypothetical protein
MQVQFRIAEQQQEQYFQLEQSILSQIFAATDNAWNWEFEHRNASQNVINDALGNLGGLMTGLQETELKNMLSVAQDSVSHMEFVVDKYKDQVDRFLEKATGSIQVQRSFSKTLNENVDTMSLELDKFEGAVQDYIHEQEVKAAWNFFKCILNIFTAALVGDPLAVIEGIEEYVDMLLEIKAMLDEMDALYELIDDLDELGLEDITINPSTEFASALQQAISLQLKGPKFDTLAATAEIKLDLMSAATDGGIDGTDDLMMSMRAVADVGRRLIAEVADFADTTLGLAERQDELRVAKEDLITSIKQVEDIKQMLIELEETKKQYEEDMKQSQEEYEKVIEQMKANYTDMSEALREEFKKNITEKYNKYQEQFDTMRQAYIASLNGLMTNIQDKGYGLKITSMNYRSMMLVLYNDFCDSMFYHGFFHCTEETAPLMSDDFEVLLSKLNDLQWDAVTNTNNLPGTPIKFGPDSLTIVDTDLYNAPVRQLKNTSTVELNLRHFISDSAMDQLWRFRISMMRVLLLDINDDPVPSIGTDFGEAIAFGITYPNIFNDTDVNHDSYTFLAQHFYCRASYETAEGI